MSRQPWERGVHNETADYQQARGWLVTLAKFDLGFRAIAVGLNTVVYIAVSILAAIALTAVGVPLALIAEERGIPPELQLTLWSAAVVVLATLWFLGLITVLVIGWVLPGWLKRTFGIDPRR